MTTEVLIDDDASLFSNDGESIGGIFSSDDESSGTPCTLKDLEAEFKARDELLGQLTEGIDPKFARMMRRNEQAAREQKILLLNACPQGAPLTPETSISSHSQGEGLNTTLVEDEEKTSPSKNGAFVFYTANMMRAIVILLLNCVAYNGFEQIVRSFVVALSGNLEFEHLRLLPFLLLILSVGLLCMTGGIWEYINDDTYRVIKFDMKNRHALGKWDAMVIKWFHHHELLEMSIIRPLCFFTCVYVVFAFQEQGMSFLFDMREELFQELPSVKQGAMTSVQERLSTGLEEMVEIQRFLGDNATCGAAESTCAPNDFGYSLALQDEAFLASSMSVDSYGDFMGDKSAVLVSEELLFWYFCASTITAILILRLMGHHFWSV